MRYSRIFSVIRGKRYNFALSVTNDKLIKDKQEIIIT